MFSYWHHRGGKHGKDSPPPEALARYAYCAAVAPLLREELWRTAHEAETCVVDSTIWKSVNPIG